MVPTDFIQEDYSNSNDAADYDHRPELGDGVIWFGNEQGYSQTVFDLTAFVAATASRSISLQPALLGDFREQPLVSSDFMQTDFSNSSDAA